MTIANLPTDLETEILARVPGKSLHALKTTCKRWCALFRDPKFVEKNKKMMSSESARECLLLTNNEVYSIARDLYELYNSVGVVEPTIEFTGKLTSLKSWEDLYFIEIYHCDGLMLCQTKDNPRLVVWNPCTGQTKRIKPRTRYGSYGNYSYALGLGYSTTCSRHSYKIARSCCVLNDKRVMVAESQIYELSSDSWREVVFDSFSLEGTSVLSGCVSLKGDCYWVAENETTGCFLMKFDFTAERFARLPLPFQSDDDVSGTNVLLSVVRDEKLAVSHALVGSDVVRIWITNKIDENDLSWRTDFVLQVDCAKYNVTMDNFLLDEENKVAVCCGKYSRDRHVTTIYIVGEDMYKQVYLHRYCYPYNWPLLITYVPSLVRIP